MVFFIIAMCYAPAPQPKTQNIEPGTYEIRYFKDKVKLVLNKDETYSCSPIRGNSGFKLIEGNWKWNSEERILHLEEKFFDYNLSRVRHFYKLDDRLRCNVFRFQLVKTN